MPTNQPALIAFSILLALFAAPTAMAQSAVWSVRLDEQESTVDIPRDVATDSEGNTYVCGVNYVGWVVWKLAPDGSVLWTWNDGDPIAGIYQSNRIGVLANGALRVVGSAGGGFSIVSLSPAGEPLFVRTHEPAPKGEPLVAFSQNGYVAYLVSREEQIVLALIDPAGELLWERSYETPAGPTLFANALEFGPDNSLLLGVSVPRNPDQNPTRIVVARFDLVGELVSEFVVPSEFNDKVRALATDASGHIAVAGTRKRGVELTTALAVLLSPDGSVMWEDTLGAEGERREYRKIAIDEATRAFLFGGVSTPPTSTPTGLILSRFELDGLRSWTVATGPGEIECTLRTVGFDANGIAHLVGNWANTATAPIVVRSYTPDGQIVRDISYLSGSHGGDALTGALVSPNGAVLAVTRAGLDIAATNFELDGAVAWRSVVGSYLGRDDGNPRAVSDGAGGTYVTSNDSPGIQSRLAHINAEGNLLWFRPIPGLRTAARVARDPAGNVVIGGFVIGGDAYSDPAILRVSPDGELLNMTPCPAHQGGPDWITGFAVDNAGNAHVTIVSEQFVPPAGSFFHRRYTKISPNGEVSFSVDRRGAHIVTDLDGYSFTIGTDESNANFSRARITRYTPPGTVEWQVFVDDLGRETVAVAGHLGSDGNLYILGHALEAPGRELLMLSYTRSGDRRWVTTFGGDWEPRPVATHFALDAENTMVIAIAAYANDTAGSRPMNSGLVVVNSDGTVRSAAMFEGLAGDERPHGVAVDSSGWVYLHGGAGGYFPPNGFVLRCDLDCVPYWSTRFSQSESANSYVAVLPTDDGGIIAVGQEYTRLTQNDIVINRFSAPPPCELNGRCEGDADGDCAVSIADLAVVLARFGTHPALLQAPANGDMDIDGSVVLSDLAIVLRNFGTTCD
ncbi:MAG: hypothetical protein ACKVS9_04445 [Phycisphaerae bacterium]